MNLEKEAMQISYHGNSKALERLGESSINIRGETMVIVEYKTVTDIDVQFANGVIKQHVPYQNFKAGFVRNPLSERIG